MELEELLKSHLANYTGLAAETAAILFVAYGTLEAGVRAVRGIVRRTATPGWRKTIWAHFGMWLLLSLQFALAADIARSAIAPSWNEIGQLAAVAAIRTFLGYFLGRDLVEAADVTAEPRTD